MSEHEKELTTEEMKKKAEEAEKELEANARLFDPKALATRNKQLFEKVDPHFGRILYGKITMEELDEIGRLLTEMHEEDNKTLKTEMILWKMLQKGCPELTLDDIRTGYGFDDVTELVALLTSGDFFRFTKAPQS